MSSSFQISMCAMALTLILISGTFGAPKFVSYLEEETDETIDVILAKNNNFTEGSLTEDGHIMSELDLKLTPEQYHTLKQTGNAKRAATADVSKRWPNAEMPFRINKKDFSVKELYLMTIALTELERYTCLKMKPRNDEKNYAYFVYGNNCQSQLGMVGGAQEIVLGKGCRFEGLFIHEMMHALGVIHEHVRPDRDLYIDTFLDNVAESSITSFTKALAWEANTYGTKYSYTSIMHYSTTAFTGNGKTTLLPKDRTKTSWIGRVFQKGIGYRDVQLLNLMYKCADRCPNKNKCDKNGHLGIECNCICEDGSDECDTTKRHNVDRNCKNAYFNEWDCHRKADQGECIKNKPYMAKQCAKACGFCGAKKVVAVANDCSDVKDRCLTWRDRGECISNPDFMETNCKATCNLCPGADRPEINCNNVESDSICAKLALKGDCIMNQLWMTNNCRKSCQRCDLDHKCSNVKADTDCDKWEGMGECLKNPFWMQKNCAKSCDTCDKCPLCKPGHFVTKPGHVVTNPAPGPTSKTNPNPDPNCRNKHSDDDACTKWASRGDCKIVRGWVPINCAKACNLCGRVRREAAAPGLAGDQSCKDTHSKPEQCVTWASEGECVTSPTFMERSCAHSCIACNKKPLPPTAAPKPSNKCHNKHQGTECDKWAKSGECQTNKGWMGKNCAHSCSTCIPDVVIRKDTSCTNLFRSDDACALWARRGKCTSSSGWMHANCGSSCNTCKEVKTVRKPRPDRSCKNSHHTNKECDQWAAQGECSRDWVKENCQSSCGTCNRG